MKEFLTSERNEPVEFKVDGDVFIAGAPAKMPANILVRYAETMSMGRVHTAHTRFFADVMDKDSYSAFAVRLDSKENPITLSMMAEVANWLVEEIYTGKAKGSS